ncbi:MAG: hypothetical protein ABR499_01940 [Gemmatimonadaceae bacterium]
MSAVLRVLMQVVAAGLLAVGGIGLYVSIGALLAGDRLAVQTVLTTVAAFTLAALLLRRVLRRSAP